MAKLTITAEQQEINERLECQVTLISQRITEAFDADGIDDIRIPNKVSIWWVVLNIASVGKLISDIINIIKTKCITETPDTNDDQVPETPAPTNG